MTKTLTIQNPSVLVHTMIHNKYELYDVHVHSDRYVFEFHYSTGGTSFGKKEIPISRIGKYDQSSNKYNYSVNDREYHTVTADWFRIKSNVISTFEDLLIKY
jgi:hypothetical protein